MLATLLRACMFRSLAAVGRIGLMFWSWHTEGVVLEACMFRDGLGEDEGLRGCIDSCNAG